jgi:hypothetical protein
MAALGASAGAGEPAAIRKHKPAPVADRRLHDQPFWRMETFGHMPHVADHLFFRNPDRFGKIPNRHRPVLQLGYNALSQSHFYLFIPDEAG